MKPKFRHFFRSSVFPVAITLAIGNSRAATQFWDHDGASNIWDVGSSANWDSVATWTDGNVAQFNAGADTEVTVSGTVAPTSIIFGSGWANDFALIGGTIDFDTGLGSIDSSAVGLTGSRRINIGSNLTGTGGLTINAHGDLTANGGGNGAYLQLGGDNSGLSGGISITGGVVDALTNNAFGSNQITLTNGGGILDANHSVTLANNVVAGTGGGTIRLYGSANTTLSGAISGSTSLNRTDGGTLNFTGDMSGFNGTFNQQAGTTLFRNGATELTGTLTISAGTASIENTAANTYTAVNLNGGALRIKSNSNALGSATLAVGGNATLASQIGSSALTLSNNATIAGTSTLSVDAGYAAITWNGDITGTGTKVRTSSSGTLTLGGTVNMGSTSCGNVSVESNGTMTLASSAVVTAGSVFNNNNTGILNINGATVDTGTLSLTGNGSINLNSGTVTAAQVALTNQTGSLNITGGTLNTQYLNIGNGSNNSGRVVQTGGTVNVNSGGNGFRIGHWNNGANAGSVYNLSGGILDATALAANAGTARLVNIGWDGQGDMIVGGGTGNATLKAYGIQLDANGNGGGGTGGNMALTISPNGLVEVGIGGVAAASTSDLVILDGGTLRAVANSTWSANMTANDATTSNLESNDTFTATASGVISGSGAITKSGLGTVILSGANSFSGGLTVSEGTLDVRNGTALGTGAIVNNSLLYLNVAGSNTFTPAITGSGNLQTANNVTFASGTNIALGGEAFRIATGSLTVENGASVSIDGRVRLSNYNGSLRATTTITGGSLTTLGDLTDNRDSWFDVVQSGGVVTAGRLLSNQTESGQNGGGTSGNSTYTLTGGQFITGGISGGTGAAWSRGIVLNLGGGTLTASGNFTMNANTVNLTGTNGDVTIDTGSHTLGSNYGFSGAGGFIKSGSGTLNLTQAGTYSGVTAVSEGTLRVTNTLRNSSAFTASSGAILELGAVNMFVGGHGVAMGDSRLITVDGATLLMNSSFDARFGNVTLKNGATWTSNRGLSGYDALLANTDAGAATITVTNTGGNTIGSIMNGSGGIHLQGIQNFVIDDVTGDSAPDLTVSMILAAQGSSGGSAGGINKSGAGTMVLTATNTYTGGTIVNGGILQIDGGGGSATGAIRGALTINDGGQVNLNQGDALGFGSGTDSISAININGSGVLHRIGGANETLGSVAITMDGGTISAASSGMGYDLFGGATTITVNNAAAEVGRESLISARIDLRQTDSLFTVNDNAVLRVNTIGDDGGSTLTKAGVGTMIIDGDNSFNQAVNVTGGTLQVNGIHSGTGLFTVDSGATLGGTGSIAAAINVTGVLAPGASIESVSTGSLSMLSGSTLDYELQDTTGTGADLVASSGDFSLTGLVTLELNGSGVWAPGDKLTLVSYTGSWNSGLFTYDGNTLADDSTFSFDGEVWTFNYDDTSKGNNFADEAAGTYVTMTVIPEPTAALLGALGLLTLLRRRR